MCIDTLVPFCVMGFSNEFHCKKGIDKLTFYRYPLNYLVHWMIPLSLNFFFIQF